MRKISNARGDMFRKPEGIGTCPQSTSSKLRKSSTPKVFGKR